MKPLAFTVSTSPDSILQWKRGVVNWSIFNFFLVALIGLGLRSFSVFSIPLLNYKFVIHAHSHFAFGGWIMPALLFMLMKFFPEFQDKIPVKTLRFTTRALFISAYGMLLSFPFSGYAPVSIGFSTINMLASLYMGVHLWKAMKGMNGTTYKFLKAAIVFLFISSLGPFATAPIIISGNAGTPLYHNAIYFYLHFQYNGWFTFAILATIYKILGKDAQYSRPAFWLLATPCVPAFFLSVLWSNPPSFFYTVSLIAASAQLLGVFLLVRDIFRKKFNLQFISILMYISIFFFVIKNVIQFASAFPEVVNMATARRNFIIAYLHMVLLGFVSTFIIFAFLKGNELFTRVSIRVGFVMFFTAFIVTELLLVANASGIWLEYGPYTFVDFIFIGSIFLPLGLFFIWRGSTHLVVYDLISVRELNDGNKSKPFRSSKHSRIPL